jgi:UDP-N-acetyl-D-galactosamine dehydrogenase
MGKIIAKKTVKMMLNSGVGIKGTKVGILGLTFIENCPAHSNSRIVDIISERNSYGIEAIVNDPLVPQQQALNYAGVGLVELQDLHDLGAIIIAVPHRQFTELTIQHLIDTLKPGGCVIDAKSMFGIEEMKTKDCNFGHH